MLLNFDFSCSHIRENTIASLKEAANNGADLVEFDVQLTKDLVPVIYHDFVVSMATKSKTDVLTDDVEMIQIPLKNFSFQQLQKLKVKVIVIICTLNCLFTVIPFNVLFIKRVKQKISSMPNSKIILSKNLGTFLFYFSNK